jgi:hypothetical protein
MIILNHKSVNLSLLILRHLRKRNQVKHFFHAAADAFTVKGINDNHLKNQGLVNIPLWDNEM